MNGRAGIGLGGWPMFHQGSGCRGRQSFMHNLQLSLCVWGGMVPMCRFLEPSWAFLPGRSGGLGSKGAILCPR
eukprot:12037271-Ditylum_brightwellii.AAC.1